MSERDTMKEQECQIMIRKRTKMSEIFSGLKNFE